MFVSTDTIVGVVLPAHQTSLFAQGAASIVATAPERTPLDEGSWIDLARGWLAGADGLLADLAASLPWEGGTRLIYGKPVVEPRLHAAFSLSAVDTPPIVAAMGAHLERRYREGFDAVFVNYYRDGRDSVAWHADRVGRRRVDPLVAIVSLGGPRPFPLRPRGGGRSVRFRLDSGDLLVMGGACQHHWEHAVPKVAVAPPRMSITFRRAP